MLVVVTGVPGSGKSTLIKGILPYLRVEDTNFLYICLDDIKDALIGDQPRNSEEYKSLKPKVLDIVFSIANTNLAAENNVITEGTFWDTIQNKDWDRDFKMLAEVNFTKYKTLRCVASEKVIKERLQHRNFNRDKEKLISETAWKEFLQREPIKTPYGGYEINTETDFSRLEAMSYIQGDH